MKHKAKSFIAVLLALCLMMSLGVGALADGGNESEISDGNTHGGNTTGGEDLGGGDDPGAPATPKGGDENPDEGEPDPYGGGGEHSISYQNGEGGTVSGPEEAVADAEVTLTVKPNKDYRLKELTVTTGSNETVEVTDNKFIMPDEDVTVSATFAKLYQILSNFSSLNGSVSVSGEGVVTQDGTTMAAAGDTVTLTVTLGDGYALSNESFVFYGSYEPITCNKVSETGNTITYTFEMPEGHVMVTPQFSNKLYSIKTVVSPAGSGSVTVNPTQALPNTKIYLEANAASGFKLENVTITKDDGSGNWNTSEDENGEFFYMPYSDVTIKATFKKVETPEPTTHNITVVKNPAEGGTVTVKVNGEEQTGDTFKAKEGDTVTFTVTPAAGYERGTVAVTNPVDYKSDPEGKYSFKMPTVDVTITVNFKELYAINVTTPDHGTVLTAPAARAAAGTPVTLSAVPDKGYELVGYTVTKDGGGAVTVTNGQFTMPDSAVTVTAAFKKVETEPETHKITVSAPNADIYIVGGADREEGDVVSFTVKPDSGYKVVGVWAGNEKLTAVNGVYSFTMPDNTVAIVVECRPLDWPDWSDWYNIDTWSNSVDGGISVGDDADMALAGSTVTFRVWHNYRYDYYDYDVYVLNDRTGNRVSLDYSAYDDEYSFTMPEDDVTIYVYFDYAGRYTITKDVEGDGSIYVRSSADHGDTVWIEASPNAGQSLTSLRVFYGEPWAYGDKGYYGYWDEAEVKYSTYWDAYYFTMPADDVVVYARFTDGATVDVITGDHGDAKVSSRYAEKGDWVYITAYPDEGYEVDSVTVTDSLGRSVKVTELSYDYFLFTMPGTNVDVKVTFRVKDYDVFYDVSRGDWYYKAVRFVHEKGIMEGTGTHYFSPEADLSRGMLATILYRLEGSPAVSGYSGFADVADTAYYAKAVAWAKANGIVNGVTATAYEPDTAVTREELAAILCRYAAFKGKDTAISYDYLAGFSDANTSHVYARPALNWAVAYDIINGQGNGVLAPRATATRAEVAQVLMNYLEVFD